MDPVFGGEEQRNGHAAADEYSGFDQSIPQLCFALKTKLEKALDPPKNILSIALIKSLEEELSIAAALFRRAINHHESTVRRLPPEILAAVASHLGDNGSLIAATHVCHHWRSTFLSFPHLWSYIVFSNTQRALAFLKRSKSIPVSVHLPREPEPPEVVKESLKSIAGRLVGLEGFYNRILGEFLTQSLPLLRDLGFFGSSYLPRWRPPVPALPSVRSLVTRNLDCPPRVSVKNLTHFRFELLAYPSRIPSAFGDTLLEFLRGCPLLEVVHLSCGLRDRDIESTIGSSTEIVSLPHLRSFTHDSLIEKVGTALFDRLSVPPTCDLAFATVVEAEAPPWARVFPTSRNWSYISGIKTVKVKTDFQATHTTFRTEFLNSKNARVSFAFTRTSIPCRSTPSINLLDFLERSGIAHSVETLCLENSKESPQTLTDCLMRFDNLKALILRPLPRWQRQVDALVTVRKLSVLWQKNGAPLETVTVFSRDISGLLRKCGREIEELKGCVGSMELVKLGD